MDTANSMSKNTSKNMSHDVLIITATERAVLDKLLDDKRKRMKWAADYYRRRYAEDAEFSAKKAEYKRTRYANDAAYRDATKARVADNRARYNALTAVRYLFTTAQD